MSRLLLLVAVGLLLVAFRAILPDLWAAWQTDEYSHGVLIPLIAILIGWHRLTEKRLPACPSWLGLPVMGAAMLCLVIGRLAAFSAIAEYGLVFGLASISLGWAGYRPTLVLAPAFLYLFFAVPLPHIAYAALSQDLQLWSSTLGVWLLDRLAIPVYQQGNIIDLGGLKLQVVEACSGLRYLFPLLSFSYLVAWLLQDRWWKKTLIFLSAIPLTIGMNSLRIALIGVTVDRWGQQMAEGFVHGFEGLVVFLICVLLLLAGMEGLRRIGHRGRFRLDYLAWPARSLPLLASRPAAPRLAVLAAAAGLAMLGGSLDTRLQQTIPHPAFASFPLVVDQWHGRARPLPPDILQALQLSDYWLADYSAPAEAAPVDLYLAYYASQQAGSAAHSPANCIPGGGWQIASNEAVTVKVSPGQTIRLSRLLIRQGDTAQLVYYWFDERGRDLTETYSSKWFMLIDAIFMRRTDGALIRLVTPLAASEDETKAAQRLDRFLAAVYPQIPRFIPGTGAAPLVHGTTSP